MSDWQAPDTTMASLRGLCPRCGAPTLFETLVGFAPTCKNCGLDYSPFNVGDGPAAFLILIVGAIIMIGIVSLELAVGPPIWVHVILWLPLTILLVTGCLRIAKGALLILEYRNKAHEGRRVE